MMKPGRFDSSQSRMLFAVGVLVTATLACGMTGSAGKAPANAAPTQAAADLSTATPGTRTIPTLVPTYTRIPTYTPTSTPTITPTRTPTPTRTATRCADRNSSTGRLVGAGGTSRTNGPSRPAAVPASAEQNRP